MCPSSVWRPSTGYDSFDKFTDHSTTNRQPYWFTPLLRPGSTIATVGRSTKVCYRQVAAGHECCSASCEQHEEVRPRLDTPASLLSCIGWMWQIESHTSLGWRCTSACMARHRIICLSCVHRSLKLLNDSIFVPPAAIYSLFHGFSSIRTAVAPRCRWTNDMELVPKQFTWAGHANWLFSSYTEDVSFWSVLGTLSALGRFLRRCAI